MAPKSEGGIQLFIILIFLELFERSRRSFWDTKPNLNPYPNPNPNQPA